MLHTEVPTEVDPFIAERVVAIRDRFGMAGLRAAHDLIGMEMAILEATLPQEAEPRRDG